MHFNGIFKIRESIVDSRFVGTVRTLYFPALHVTFICVYRPIISYTGSHVEYPSCYVYIDLIRVILVQD